MKRIVTILFLLTATAANAQQYVVYRTRGIAEFVVGQQATRLKVGQRLSDEDILSLAHQSEVKLVAGSTKEMLTIKGQAAGSISTLLSSQNATRQKMTAQYFSFVLNNLRGRGYNEAVQSGRSTTVFRDESDSIFVDKPQSLNENTQAEEATHSKE
ncbi:MAG: hypothetical protein IJ659_07510 [Alloprevotella sp.]|nr:hypothetical protein [Alloprevotella sp.]